MLTNHSAFEVFVLLAMALARISSLVAIALAVAVAVVSVNTSTVDVAELEWNIIRDGQNNLIVGERAKNDHLDYQENISVGASLIGKKVVVEKTFNVTKGHVITQIRALDQATDGTGATSVITAGGPERNSVTLRFKSQRFHGVYFVVQLYAKPGY